MRRNKDRSQSAPLSEDRLKQAAYRYLERFSATETTLLRVLQRKIKRTLGPDADTAEIARWDEAAARVARACVDLGLVDDRAYAVARARRLHARGQPVGRITGALVEKGVAPEDITGALDALAEDAGPALDLRAAVAYARRRRFGPFSRQPVEDPDARRKVLAAFGRAGFPYAVACTVLDAPDVETLDALIAEDEGQRSG